MGLDINGTSLMIWAKQKRDVSFKRAAMIGRQKLYVSEARMGQLMARARLQIGVNEVIQEDGYSESFFRLLGAGSVDSIDASTYEGATIIQDMNRPLPTSHAQFSIVVDGGSLEHIFNFPQAIQNCMKMVEIGGHFAGITPTNNFPGHGFYQFSPELYYRIFNEKYGFKLEEMLFFTEKRGGMDSHPSEYFRVRDPIQLQRRVEMINMFPSYLFVLAKKVQECDFSSFNPQQSDYAHGKWVEQPSQRQLVEESFVRRLLRYLFPYRIRRWWYMFRRFQKPLGMSNSLDFEAIKLFS